MVAGIQEVLDTLAEVVTEFGRDYVYQGKTPDDVCLYLYHGEPDCLAAKVMSRLGVPHDRFEERHDCTQLAVGEFISADAIYVLRLAQVAQDAKETWGRAVWQAAHHARVAYGFKWDQAAAWELRP
jgi:hypothetical protein